MRQLLLKRAVTLCSLALASCISDLKPEVGPLLSAQSTVDAGKSGDGPDAGGDKPAPGEGKTDSGTMATEDAGTTDDAGQQMPTPDAGSTCTVKDSDPKKDVSFAKDVEPILAACRCHDPESEDTQGILESALTIDGYEAFRKGGEKSGKEIIVAGNACASIVLQKLSESPPFGERMPFDGPPYLTLEQRTVLSDWITEGARDN